MSTTKRAHRILPGVDGPGVKSFSLGTDRTTEADETISRVVPKMQSMGITRVANVTGLDRIGIPVVAVCRPQSRSHAISWGSGSTLAEARCSGLMSSIASYHSERIPSPLVHASYEEMLEERRVVDLDRLPRAESTAFDPRRCILWIEGFDLMGREPTWVPYELVHTNFTLPLPAAAGCFPSSLDGLSSGNHLLEAISEGLCERVKSDAIALWEFAGGLDLAHTRIDLHTVEDVECRHVLERYDAAGLDITAWEVTSDVGIPAFTCQVVERGQAAEQTLQATSGAGCHWNSAIALLRALTDAALCRLTTISGERDHMAGDPRVRGLEPPLARAAQVDRLEPRDAPSPFPAPAREDAPTFEEDVRAELESLHQVGIRQAIVIDLTRSRVGIPVVRVVVPGLESAIGAEERSSGIAEPRRSARERAASRVRGPASRTGEHRR